MSEQIGQVLAKLAGQQTCGDNPRLGEQSVEGLLYRERAGTRLCLKWEEKVRMGLKDKTFGPGEWIGALVFTPEHRFGRCSEGGAARSSKRAGVGK